jgi:ABC-type nitrate/sulfonate/bicarbonate transport system substrate-binding protein
MTHLPLARRTFLAAAASVAVPAFAQQMREISIGLSSASLGSASLRIAKEMGICARHGITPKFIVMDSGNAAIAALVSRSVDFSVAGPGEFVIAKARGQNLVALANCYKGLVASLVLAKPVVDKLGVSPKAPIADRLKALDRLVIGSPSATSVVATAYGAGAKSVGASIRFTYIGQTAMPAALDSGAIQGYGASAPFWAIPVLKGTGVLWINGPGGEIPPEFSPSMSAHLQATREFAEANPALIDTMLAIQDEFAHAVDADPAGVRAGMAKVYPDLDAKMLDLLFANESPAWKGHRVTAQNMAHEIRMVKSTGVQMPSLDALDPASMIYP